LDIEMNQALAHIEPAQRPRLAREGTLRVAAATLSRLGGGEDSATTVVGVLGADDIDAFRALIREIADEFGLDASIQFHVGSYSVRFSGADEHAWIS
jgi:hypothetical protein